MVFPLTAKVHQDDFPKRDVTNRASDGAAVVSGSQDSEDVVLKGKKSPSEIHILNSCGQPGFSRRARFCVIRFYKGEIGYVDLL